MGRIIIFILVVIVLAMTYGIIAKKDMKKTYRTEQSK